MAYLANILDLQDYRFGKKWGAINYVAVSCAAFLIPFLLGQPQLLVGSMVNCALVFGAFNYPKKVALSLMVMPSLAILSRGLIFGPMTYYLIYLIPAIWLANFSLVSLIKYLYLRCRLNKYLSVSMAIAAKVIILYAVVWLLVGSNILPKTFTISMGIIQLYTAAIGGVLAITMQKIVKKQAAI